MNEFNNPFYVTLAKYGALGLGNACDPTDFDGAVDAWGDCMENDTPARVYRMEPPKVTAAGLMIDVTADAKKCVAKRFKQRNQDVPEWALS